MVFGEFIFLVTMKQSFGRYLYLIISMIKLMYTENDKFDLYKNKKENKC